MVQPQVPGYRVARLLGRGGGGEVWLATHGDTGETVAIKCVRPGSDLAARDRLRREAALLAGIRHPHVLRLRTVVGCRGPGDEVALVLDLATGGSLARLVARHGPRPPGEVVTVLAPLAEALAHVHGRGVAHGDVTPGNVLFHADGRPVLSDLGVARLVGDREPGTGTPGFRDPFEGAGGGAADVHGLAATGFLALTGQAPYDGDRLRPATTGPGPRSVLDLVRAVLAAPPEDRPTAAELATQVHRAAPALPVLLDPLPAADVAVDPAGGGAEREGSGQPLTVVSRGWRAGPPLAEAAPATAAAGSGRGRHRAAGRPARRTSRQRTAIGVLAALAVASAALTGMAWAGSAPDPRPASGVRPVVPPTAAPAGSTSPPVPRPARSRPAVVASWPAVLRRLDGERAAAFATGDRQRLAAVYTDGSPAGRRDRRELARLVGKGQRAAAMRPRLVRVAALRAGPRRARLRVVDVLPAYWLADPAGRRLERRAGRGRAAWVVTLALQDGRWRVYDVARG